MCKEGFTGDPLKHCHDIDECSALEKPCGSHAICQNAEPGYNCLCPQGYQAHPNPEVACEQVKTPFIHFRDLHPLNSHTTWSYFWDLSYCFIDKMISNTDSVFDYWNEI